MGDREVVFGEGLAVDGLVEELAFVRAGPAATARPVSLVLGKGGQKKEKPEEGDALAQLVEDVGHALLPRLENRPQDVEHGLGLALLGLLALEH